MCADLIDVARDVVHDRLSVADHGHELAQCG